MRVTAAVVEEESQPFEIEELELEEPRADEVLVRIVATGCVTWTLSCGILEKSSGAHVV